MKLLLTGVSSFTGYHLAKKLCLNYNVIGIISKNRKKYKSNRLKRLVDLEKKIKIIECDLNKSTEFIKILKRVKPVIIYINHAYTVKNINDFNLNEALTVNLLGLREIFDYCSKNNCKVLHTGTNQEYGNKDNLINEKTIKNPSTEYGFSKKIQSEFLKFFSEKYMVKCTSFKLFNLYGLLDEEHKLIQMITDSIYNQKKIKLNTSGNDYLDFLHVNEFTNIVSDYLKLSQKKYYEEFIISSKFKISLKEFIYLLLELTDINKESIVFSSKPRTKKIINLGNNSKISKLLKRKFLFKKMLINYLNELKNS